VVVPAGIPRGVSLFLLPSLGVALLWIAAACFVLSWLGAAPRSAEELIFPLSLVLFCALRALVGVLTVLAACQRWPWFFLLGSVGAIGIDGALVGGVVGNGPARVCCFSPDFYPQVEDYAALLSLATQGALGLGFAWSVWRRRGLTELDAPQET
jgi:hypothetical protein